MLLLAYSTDGIWTPLPLLKGEDEGEGLFFCRSSSVKQIARNTLSSSWRTYDSRIAAPRLHGEPEIGTGFDRDFGPHRSYARRRPTR